MVAPMTSVHRRNIAAFRQSTAAALCVDAGVSTAVELFGRSLRLINIAPYRPD
jgi:hypothetical protein